MSPLRLVFFGTSNFAVPVLEVLLKYPKLFEVVLVVSQASKPVGRTQAVTPSPLTKFAQSQSLTIVTPLKIKTDDFVKTLNSLSADLFVVAAYGKILSKQILDLPKFGALNLHGSLLPKYRGATPIQTALVNQELQTGVTLMLMDEELDHGPILAATMTTVDAQETFSTLENKLAKLAGPLLIDNIEAYVKGGLKPQAQNHHQATFTKVLDRADGEIKWLEVTALALEAKLRAYNPWPGLWTTINKDGRSLRLKILVLSLVSAPVATPGLVAVGSAGFIVGTKSGAVQLDLVQVEGKKPISGQDFMMGYSTLVGQTFH